MMAWWQLKPVQFAAKIFAAGSLMGTSIWAYKKVTTVIAGSTDAPLKNLQGYLRPAMTAPLSSIWTADPDWIDLLARLESFNRFAPKEFEDIVVAVDSATAIKAGEYATKITATSSFKIRAAFQKVIECVRVFRSILEHQIPTALEDFDEVAVDINSKIEQVSSDAIQDCYI